MESERQRSPHDHGRESGQAVGFLALNIRGQRRPWAPASGRTAAAQLPIDRNEANDAGHDHSSAIRGEELISEAL